MEKNVENDYVKSDEMERRENGGMEIRVVVSRTEGIGRRRKKRRFKGRNEEAKNMKE